MRIGYVLKKFPRLSETFILNEILELERQGVEVTPISLHLPDDGVFHPGVARLARPVVYLADRGTEPFLEALRANWDLVRGGREGLFRAFEEGLLAERPDLVAVLRAGILVAIEARRRGLARLHAHFATVATHVARVARLLSGIPYSFTCHAKDIYREGVRPEVFAALAATADRVVTVCEANARHIRETLLGGRDGGRVVTIHNGVDLDLFRPRPEPAEGPPLVLGIGRLVEKKGFHHLVRAAARLERAGRAFDCAIAGEGEERGRLEALARTSGASRIRFLGARNHDEVRALLGRATLLVQPCTVGADGNRDALPTVLLEALASGVPVVTTPVGGIEEIVGGGEAGALVPVDDPDALATAIARLLDDPAERRALAQRGRARAEALFDVRKNVARLRAIFEGG